MIFEIYTDHAHETRVRMKGNNGEILPDGYTSPQNAEHFIKILKNEAATAVVIKINHDDSKEDITYKF